MLRQRAARGIGFRAREEPERDPALFELVLRPPSARGLKLPKG
jgi:hypothetical protein